MKLKNVHANSVTNVAVEATALSACRPCSRTRSFFTFLLQLATLSCFTCVVLAGAPSPLFFPPSSPTSNADCQSFNVEVEQYSTSLADAHAQCLSAYIEDRPGELPDSRTCSRSQCQQLHDLLFESGALSPNSVNAKRADLAACYRHVQQYQASVARDEREESERQSAEQQREEQAARQRSESRAPAVKHTPAAASSYGGTPSLGDLFAAQSQALSDMREHWIDRQMQIDQEAEEKRARQRARLQQEEAVALSAAAGDAVEEKRADRQDVISDFQSDAETLAKGLDSSKPNMISEQDSLEHSLDSNRKADTSDIALQAALSLRGNELEHLLGLVNDDGTDSHGPLVSLVNELTEGAASLYQKSKNTLENPETSLEDGTIANRAVDLAAKHDSSPAAMLTESSDSLKAGVTYELRDLLRTNEKSDESAQTVGSWLRDKIVSKASAKAIEYFRSAPADRACGDSESGSLSHSFCVLNAAASPFNISKGIKPYMEDVQLKFADFFQIATGQVSGSTPTQ